MVFRAMVVVVSGLLLLQACSESVRENPSPCFGVTCDEAESSRQDAEERLEPRPGPSEDASPVTDPDQVIHTDLPTRPPVKPVVLWPYQLQPVCHDGRNDCPDIQRTAQAINDLGATALYLPIGTSGQYSKLISFLENSQETDIKVWVRAHHSCMQEPPPYKGEFRGDCTNWITHLAELSKTYPNLEAVHFDDLHPLRHPDIATPALIENVNAIKNRINPALKFVPALYYDSSDELQFFRPENPFEGLMKDGASMWYSASYGSRKRVTDTAALQAYVDEAKTLIPPGLHMTGIYVRRDGALNDTGDLDTLFHDPAELEKMLDIAYSGSDGICLFNFPLHVYDTDYLLESTIFEQQPSDLAAYEHKLTTSQRGTYASWFQEIKTSVPVQQGDSINVKLKIKDTAFAGDTGYVYKQLIVDGEVAWQVDVRTDGTEEQIVERTVQARGAVAEISVRLLSKKPNWINASLYLDNPAVSIGGKPTSAQWQFNSTLSKLREFRQIYDIAKRVIHGVAGR